MSQGENRSLDEMEGSSVATDAYLLSSEELCTLKKCTSEYPLFAHYSSDNCNLDIDTKMAAVKVSQSVVSLVSFSGEAIVAQACGTIIDRVDNVYTVITSLSLLRRPTKGVFMENSLARSLKVIVNCSDDKSYIGEVEAYDFHYNILIIKFKSMSTFPTANLKILDRPFQLRPLSRNNDSVIVAGRYFYPPFDFMAAPAKFSVDRSRLSKYDCNELVSSNCNIPRCGDGSPLINLAGEVVGIAYYMLLAVAPILPIDVAYKWWSHYKEFKESRHPSYGFIASNLYPSARLSILALFEIKFPSISNGLLVEEVKLGSNAEVAGLRENDIIIKCNGKSLRSFMELWKMMWDNVGNVIELEVARVDSCSIHNIGMVVEEAALKERNKWPRYI